VKSETADHLRKARQFLADARTIAGISLHHIAAREAYLAAFHAAEAYIWERTGTAVKTHRGLRVMFSRLARDEPRIAQEYVAFLARGYELKSIVDYDSSRTTPPVSAESANSAIDAAGRFIDAIDNLLASDPHAASENQSK
jgi:uncharacterized protein (UPF0332 family)